MHTLIHKLKKVADQHDGPAFSSVPNKVSRLCCKINYYADAAEKMQN